jgi:glutamate racemase
MRGEVVDPAIYTKAMAGLMDQPYGERIDVTVLGCTHFPLVEDDLLVAAPHMRFVDGATGIARRICHLTKDQSWPEKKGRRYFRNDRRGQRTEIAAAGVIFFGYNADPITVSENIAIAEREWRLLQVVRAGFLHYPRLLGVHILR